MSIEHGTEGIWASLQPIGVLKLVNGLFQDPLFQSINVTRKSIILILKPADGHHRHLFFSIGMAENSTAPDHGNSQSSSPMPKGRIPDPTVHLNRSSQQSLTTFPPTCQWTIIPLPSGLSAPVVSRTNLSLHLFQRSNPIS